MHGTTFGGGPLACAVAIAVIDAIEQQQMLAHIQRIGGIFQAATAVFGGEVFRGYEVRGLGLMLALDLKRRSWPSMWRPRC